MNFYALRHTFETIGGESKDQVAVDLIMGHTDPSMAGHYRERIDDARLKAVTDHVNQLTAAERKHLRRAVARKLGPSADAHDPPVLDPDRAIVDHAQRIAGRGLHRRDAAIDKQSVPHCRPHGICP